ncbi:unnamed protein product, partial [Polarella glacialis]
SATLENWQLGLISVGPRVLDFSNVYVKSQVVKSFSVYNDLPQAILVSMQYDSEELSRSTPISQVIPSAQAAGFDVVICSAQPQSFQRQVVYTINGMHAVKLLIKAEITPVQVRMSRSEILYRFGEDSLERTLTEQLMLSNHGNAPARYSWQGINSSFNINPMSGIIRAGASVVSEVVFTPPNSGAMMEGFLTLKVEDGNDQSLRCAGQAPEAVCAFGARRMDLGVLAVGLPSDRSVALINSGKNAASSEARDAAPGEALRFCAFFEVDLGAVAGPFPLPSVWSSDTSDWECPAANPEMRLYVEESTGQDAVHGSMSTFDEFVGLYCFLVIVAPRCFTLRRHYVACILINLSLLYCVHTGSEMGNSYTYYRSLNELLFLLRIGQAAIYGNFVLQFCLNIMATGFSFVMAEVWASADCSGLFSVDDLTTFSLRSELAVIFMSMAVCVTTDWAFSSEAQVTVESKTSRNVEATAQSLLSVLCDAVVRLGPDFRITTPSPRLAALLLKSPGPLCLEGKVFTDLVHPEDRECIARQLEVNIGGPVQLLRIRMPDSDGRLLTVQAFHSTFLEMDVRTTPAFKMISGPSPEGDNILDWVRSPDRFERLVQDWMQMMPIQDEACVAIGRGGEANAAEQVLHMSAGIQIFCPPATLSCGIQYAAACSLEYQFRTPESFTFKLTLSEVKQHKLRRSPTGRHPLQTGRQQDHRSGRSKSALAILSERGIVDTSC